MLKNAPSYEGKCSYTSLLSYLERKGEEVSPDLPKLCCCYGVVIPIVEILDITHLGITVVGHHLAPVPPLLTGGHTHGVQFDWLGNLGQKN